ncbi:hypothetical protein HID58_038692 [Brassica napus]|uniref:Uncharacterized protein n=2 Tax=Brassica TaxID=3705 RepID=A0ABQ8BRK1_BRANA|nr:hypothetical protein HID58_038692 [Brassica napus]CAG7910593.1 unnamed protein product [Brassica rapa]VDD18329.1 unnamed protein product [Brassica rapa]
MAPLVAGPASLPRPPSDPPDSNLKVALLSNPPDPPVPPDSPPDTLSFTGLLQLYDLWVTVTVPHKFSDPKLSLMISYELGLLDPSFSLLVPTVSVTFSYATVAFVGTFVVYVWSFTAVCSCPFTAVCRLPSTFALMAFVMIWHSLLPWQLGVKVLKLCIFPANLVCLGFNCPPFSFKESFVLPYLSLVTSEIVIGNIVLKMVLFEAEAKMFIVSRLDGVNYLTALTMEGFIPSLYCFEEECQFEEVFLFDCPLSETTVVELVISPLSLSFYLSTCCLSFLICLSSVLVYALVCLALCSFIVSSIDGVELF